MRRSTPRRRNPTPPPTQSDIWPERFTPLARARGRWRPDDPTAGILRAAVRATGRKLRWSDPSGRPAGGVRLPAVDPAAAAVMACARIARLIGRPEISEDPDAPAWVQVDRTATVPVVRLFARGALIQGEKISRALVGGRIVAVEANTGGQRLFSLEALRQAAELARQALTVAGVAVGHFLEVRPTRQGGVAVIGLRRVSPVGRAAVSMGT